MLKSRVLLIFIIVTSLFLACGGGNKEAIPEGDRWTIYVTIQPLKSLAEAIVGDKAKVNTLLPLGSDPHSYEPSPDDVRKLANSAILFQIGIGMDEWASAPALEAEDGPRIVPVSIGVPVLPALPDRLWKKFLEEDKVAKHGNPHIWLDPAIVEGLVVPQMTKAIISADPQNEQFYRANSSKLRDNLKAMSDEIRSEVAHLKGSAVILNHGAFVYFCRQYGLRVIDIIEPFPGQEPTAKDLTEIIENAAEEGPVAILSEKQVSPKPAEVIAEELGIPIVSVDPLGNPDETYLQLIRRNVSAIASIKIE